MNKHLGKLLKVGEAFLSTSKRMMKGNNKWNTPVYKLYKVGDKDYFTKGKRRYYCVVKALQETKTGFIVNSYDPVWTHDFTTSVRGPRYWQFTYLVQIIEN